MARKLRFNLPGSEICALYQSCLRSMQLPPLEFAFDYLTRSGRVDMERLRGISPWFIEQYEHYLAAGTSR